MQQRINKYLGTMMVIIYFFCFPVSGDQSPVSQANQMQEQLSLDKASSASQTKNIDQSIWQTWQVYSLNFILLFFCIGLFYLYRVQKHKIHMRLLAQICHSEEQLQLALWCSGEELWDWKIDKHNLSRSNTFLKYPENELTLEDSIKYCLHPNDQKRVFKAIKSCLYQRQDELEITYRSRTNKDDWLWVNNKIKVIDRDEQGKATRIIGTIKNIQPMKETLHTLAKKLEKKVTHRSREVESCQMQLNHILKELSLSREQLKEKTEAVIDSPYKMSCELNFPVEVCLTTTYKLQQRIEEFRRLCDGDTLYREDVIAYQQSLKDGCHLLANKLERISKLIKSTR